MLMLPFVGINFLSKRNVQGKHSNLQKSISWKRNRLEIINKIEAKRASNATREHTTLVGVGLR